MAADPYGYPEAVAGDSTGDAASALWLGVSALALGAISPCCCYMSWIPAFPLAAAALWKGARATSLTNPHERTAATAGLVSGSIALVFSLMFIALWLFYAVYFVFVVGLVAAGEL